MQSTFPLLVNRQISHLVDLVSLCTMVNCGKDSQHTCFIPKFLGIHLIFTIRYNVFYAVKEISITGYLLFF